MIDFNELTLGQVKEIRAMPAMASSVEHPYQLGKNYFIRTVTHYYTGKLLAVYEHELVIESAAWIADTGRFGGMLKTGEMNEIEAYPDGPVILGRGAVVDATEVSFELPRVVK